MALSRGSWWSVLLLFIAAAGGCAPNDVVRHGSPPESRMLTVAAVSVEKEVGNVEFNLTRIEHWARRAAAAGAELVLFPEATISGYWQNVRVRDFAEPLDGPSIRRLVKLAGELGVVLAVGLTEGHDGKAHITHVLLDGGGLIGWHRKSSLPSGEEQFWSPGNDANVFTVCGVRVGVAICYESVKPETCAKLAAAGAEVILAPYANATAPVELYDGRRPYTFARARENRVWYVACDGTGREEDGRIRPGAAYVITPQGELAACTPLDAEGENMVVYTLRLPEGDR